MGDDDQRSVSVLHRTVSYQFYTAPCRIGSTPHRFFTKRVLIGAACPKAMPALNTPMARRGDANSLY